MLCGGYAVYTITRNSRIHRESCKRARAWQRRRTRWIQGGGGGGSLVSRRYFPCDGVVDAREALGEHAQIILYLGLFLFILDDLSVDLSRDMDE